MSISSYSADMNYETTISGGTYTSIAGVIGMSFGGLSRGSFSCAAINDASVYKAFLPTRSDAGEQSFSLNFSASVLNTLIGTLWADQVNTRNYRFEFGDGTNTDTMFTCLGFLTGIGAEFPDEGDDRIVLPITVKWSGAPTFAVAT